MNIAHEPQIQASPRRNQQQDAFILLIGLLACALIIRIWLMWPVIIDDRYFGASDDGDYHALAVSIVEYGQLGMSGHPSAYRMPLFPLFLAAIYRVAGPDRIVAQAVIIGLSVVNVGLTYAVGRQLSSQRVGLIAALIAVFDLDQINFSGQLMTEVLCTFLLTLSMLALVRLRRTGTWRWALGVGLLLGLTVLVRVNILLIAPVTAAWILRYGVGSLRKRLVSVVIILALCGGAWGSWVVRNYLAFGSFIPLTTQGGSGYYGIYNDIASAPQPLNSFGEWRNLDLPIEIQQANEVDRDRMQRQLAIAWMQAHPVKAAQIALVQVYHFWREYINPLYTSTLLLAIGGIGLLLSCRDPDGIVWFALFGTLSVVAFFTLAVPRFHAPLLPGIMAFAGIALDQIWMRLSLLLPKRAVQQPSADNR